jgi:hypothetical protein
MIVVLVVLLACCVCSRLWWCWRGNVHRRRQAAAAGESRERDLEHSSHDSLPDDAITGAIKSLPEIVWSDTADNGTASTEDAECRLCLEDYRRGDKVRLLPCGHCYHSDCIDMWLAGSRQQGMPRGERTCPLCKRDPLQGNPTVGLHRSRSHSPADVADITICEALSQFLLTGDVQGHVIFSRRGDVNPGGQGGQGDAAGTPGARRPPGAPTTAEPAAAGTADPAEAEIVVAEDPTEAATADAAPAQATTTQPVRPPQPATAEADAPAEVGSPASEPHSGQGQSDRATAPASVVVQMS